MSRLLLVGSLVAEGALSATFLCEQASLLQLLSGTLLSGLGTLPEAYTLATAWFAPPGSAIDLIDG